MGIVKSRQKLAETPPGLMLASVQLAQTDVYNLQASRAIWTPTSPGGAAG